MSASIIAILNRLGTHFCEHALSMLVQSSILILLLLVLDLLLRRRIKAVLRYCIWLLVFVKLVVPPALSLPTGIGYWCSDYLPVHSIDAEIVEVPTVDHAQEPAASYSMAPLELPSVRPPESVVEIPVEVTSAVVSASPSISWPAVLFLAWFFGVLVLAVLLVQRAWFVKRLIAQSERAEGELIDMLSNCCRQLGIRKRIELRISHNALSPAACGLSNPVILLPSSLLGHLCPDKLRTVLVHELVHIKRGDLWVNFIQTVLQILYFYNPLLWLANAIIRRVREQAVDEAVLVSLGDKAKTYSSTLVDIAEIAFTQPSLGLRLIGVVESKKALASRIKHITSRRFPKTAKLGVLGLVAVITLAVIILPMARTKEPTPATSIVVATIQPEPITPVTQEITGAELMEDSGIVKGLMPAIKLTVEGHLGEKWPRIPRIFSEPGPGVLHAIIIDESDTSRHLAPVFFVPVEKWPGRALFWYLAYVNESFEITGIPPGEYYLFSVEADNPQNIDSVGLPVDWPQPVNIRADGEPAQVEIRISGWLSKKVRSWNSHVFLRGGLGHLNAENVLTEQLGPFGKVTDSDGKSLPYVRVQVRGLEADGKDWEVISVPDARTNQQGYYGTAPLGQPYFVGAIANEPLKHVPGYRWQHLRRNNIFEGKHEINFQIAPWPTQLTGGGTIEGTVVDANGQAIPSFTVDVRDSQPSIWPHKANEPWTQKWGIRAAFAKGKFVIEDVPAGVCKIRVVGHKSCYAGRATEVSSQVTVAAGQKVELAFEVRLITTEQARQMMLEEERKMTEKMIAEQKRLGKNKEVPREPFRELKVGEQAPAFEIQTIDGKKWALTDYRGKVVLLCFWRMNQSWTEIECSYFKSTYEAFGADERFVMMSLVTKPRSSKAPQMSVATKTRIVKELQQYVTRYGLNWNHAFMDEQVEHRLRAAYGVKRRPSVILIGPDGKILARNLQGNAMSWAVEKALTMKLSKNRDN